MPWLGLGVVTASNAARNPQATNDVYLAPASTYDGTAGSGFSVPPSDPTRTTAKPAARLITPPNQHFTFSQDVGVMAAANDGGDLFNTFGIEKVIYHFEGSSAEVTAPKWHTIQTQAGARTYFGWWAQLRKLIGTVGAGHLYIEAVPRDATMQSRVLGPYVYSPVDDLYDQQLEVAPSQPEIAGERYQSILAAGTYAKQQSAQNPLITITEAGKYDIGDQSTNAWDADGYCNIRASVAGVSLGKTSYTTDAAAGIAPNRMKLHLIGGNGFTLDHRYSTGLLTAAGNLHNHWLDGITFTNTAPDGKEELFRGGTRPATRAVAGRAYFTECDVSEIDTPFVSSSLVRGCFARDIGQDVVSNSFCVVQSDFGDHDNNIWNTDFPAIDVQYTGSETTATIERSGGTEGSGGGIYTVTIGAAAYTFDVGNGSEDYFTGALGDGYWFQDVVYWLNTLPDITASLLLAEDRRAATGSLAGDRGQGFGATDFKASALEIQSHFDKHGDFYQHDAGDFENVIVFFNQLRHAQTQCIFLSPEFSGSERDMLFLGNVFHTTPVADPNFDSAVAASQWGRSNTTHSHVVIAGNTFVDQRFQVRNANGAVADAYCLFSNNVLPSMAFDAGAMENLVVKNLHLYDGAATPPGSSFVAKGGDETTLFADAAGGDYAPAGDLLTSGFAPALPIDADRNSYPAFAAPGKVAAAATEFDPGSSSADPEGDLVAAMNGYAPSQSSFHDYTNATNPGTWDSQDVSDNDNDQYNATGGQQPAIGAGGATFDSGDQVRQDMSAGTTFTVIIAFTKDDASTIGSLVSDNAGSAPVQYGQGQTGAGHQADVYVDGVLTANRDLLYQALHQAGEVVVRMEGLDMSARTQLRIGRGATGMVGTVRRIFVIDEVAHAATLADDRANAELAAAL